jgi:hypothetical protein
VNERAGDGGHGFYDKDGGHGVVFIVLVLIPRALFSRRFGNEKENDYEVLNRAMTAGRRACSAA